MRELAVPAVTLLIVSFPGMGFEGDCEWEADKLNATMGDGDAEAATWAAAIEPLRAEGRARRLGVAEFGSEKLRRFLDDDRVRSRADDRAGPAVDQINVRNCCSVPPPLTELARREGRAVYYCCLLFFFYFFTIPLLFTNSPHKSLALFPHHTALYD